MALFNNRCKCVASISMYVLGIMIGWFGCALFVYWYHYVSTFEISGGDFLPELYVDFSSFSTKLMAGAVGSFICFASSMVTAYYKNKYTSSLYALLVIIFGSMLLDMTGTVEAFSEIANETYSVVCDSNLTVTNNIAEDMGKLVD